MKLVFFFTSAHSTTYTTGMKTNRRQVTCDTKLSVRPERRNPVVYLAPHTRGNCAMEQRNRCIFARILTPRVLCASHRHVNTNTLTRVRFDRLSSLLVGLETNQSEMPSLLLLLRTSNTASLLNAWWRETENAHLFNVKKKSDFNDHNYFCKLVHLHQASSPVSSHIWEVRLQSCNACYKKISTQSII